MCDAPQHVNENICENGNVFFLLVFFDSAAKFNVDGILQRFARTPEMTMTQHLKWMTYLIKALRCFVVCPPLVEEGEPKRK